MKKEITEDTVLKILKILHDSGKNKDEQAAVLISIAHSLVGSEMVGLGAALLEVMNKKEKI